MADDKGKQIRVQFTGDPPVSDDVSEYIKSLTYTLHNDIITFSKPPPIDTGMSIGKDGLFLHLNGNRYLIPRTE